MKNFLNTILLLAILGAIVYQYRDILIVYFFPVAPCSQPIPYELGTFDKKFNISQTYFLSALTDAEVVWEKPFGKDLFTYTPTNSSQNILKINLVYDYRQQATSKLASLGIAVKDDRASYDALKIKYLDLQKKIVIAKNEYALSKQEAIRININEMVTEINSMVVVLNRLANILNLSVEQYNTIGNARGESFEEGVYVSDGVNKEIDIYEFSSRAKLVRVLAHELGHALGLDHVDDPKAIMYKLNQGNNEILTEADLSELKIKCQTK